MKNTQNHDQMHRVAAASMLVRPSPDRPARPSPLTQRPICGSCAQIMKSAIRRPEGAWFMAFCPLLGKAKPGRAGKINLS
jgi:hypothetical protein